MPLFAVPTASSGNVRPGRAVWASLPLAAAGVMLVALSISAPQADAATCKRGVVSPRNEAAMLSLVNARRSKAGVARVARANPLRAAGRRVSTNMARGGAFEHDGMSWASGRSAGQNLAMASNARVAVAAMMASPGHRRNILSTRFRKAGVGAALNCRGSVFFTINLVAAAR